MALPPVLDYQTESSVLMTIVIEAGVMECSDPLAI